MAATITLAETTLTYGIAASDDTFTVGSVASISPGQCLYITDGGEPLGPGEAVTVLTLGPVSGVVKVKRGQFGTAAKQHSSGAQVFIGNNDQFYERDPEGVPLAAVYVQPWINVIGGGVFWPYGDENDAATRWWQKQTATHGIGAAGARTITTVGVQS